MANTFLERARARMAKLASKQVDAKQRVRFRVSPGEKVTFAAPTKAPKSAQPPPPPVTSPITQPSPPPVAPPVAPTVPPPPPSDIDVPGPNGGRKCSVCHKPGHTKANCPDLAKDDELTDDELEKLTAPDADKS